MGKMSRQICLGHSTLQKIRFSAQHQQHSNPFKGFPAKNYNPPFSKNVFNEPIIGSAVSGFQNS